MFFIHMQLFLKLTLAASLSLCYENHSISESGQSRLFLAGTSQGQRM